MQKAVLLFEDGKFYEGKALGKIGISGGEICFNTSMTGYQEIYTDPSYYGQVLINTHPHIGNYGVLGNQEEQSNSVKIKGLVCSEFSNFFSRPQASSLQNYLERAGIVGIYGLDTREMVRYVREKGAMNVLISSDNFDENFLKEEVKKIPCMDGLELSSIVSTKESYMMGNPNSAKKIAILDWGIKKGILDHFIERDCFLKVFPAKTSFQEMEKWQPLGYFLSNGPGDPSVMGYAVEVTKEILNSNKPLFGICLGHQILGLACGLETYKMLYGHRGGNHPVKNLETGRCEITAQNHGFSVRVAQNSPEFEVEITHKNLNDDTIEGIRVKNKKAFSVQYHPESFPGPHDSHYLFEQFMRNLNI